MRKSKALVIGGIQSKVFNLILCAVLLLTAAYMAVSLSHSNMLSRLSVESGRRRRETIAAVTGEVKDAVAELSLATRIQAAMLLHIFPPFPDRTGFDIHASMDPAREAGGGFCDCFLIDDDHLGLVIADVSGKGVPAALPMMASKMIRQSVAMLGKSPAEILTKTNEAQMFVTVSLGILELSTGKLNCANAATSARC